MKIEPCLLKWRPPSPNDEGFATALLIADGIGGRYAITEGIGDTYELWWAHDEFDHITCVTLEEAEDIAQLDWEKRVRQLVRVVEEDVPL